MTGEGAKFRALCAKIRRSCSTRAARAEALKKTLESHDVDFFENVARTTQVSGGRGRKDAKAGIVGGSADACVGIRKLLNLKDARKRTLASYCKEGTFYGKAEQERPKSGGVSFTDMYLRFPSLEQAERNLQDNCQWHHPFAFDPVKAGDATRAAYDEHKEKVTSFLRSCYYNCDGGLVVERLTTYAAWRRLDTQFAVVEVGRGGAGKGSRANLEEARFGNDAWGTGEAAWFLQGKEGRNEFRKGGQALDGKAFCRIQEFPPGQEVNSDVLKKFISGEEMELRGNYEMTRKARFNHAKKTIEVNMGCVFHIPDRGSEGANNSDTLRQNDPLPALGAG